MFRLLKAEEIECKISNTKNITTTGIQLLLYKTARTDMDILDETVGPMNWDCEYREVKSNMYCGIGIINEQGEKIVKWDCGVESAFGDKEKGEASDSFKRAGTKWGIGRELYTAPFIWIDFKDYTLTKDGKSTYDEFEVTHIAYDDNRRINELKIKNKKLNRIVFDMKAKIKPIVEKETKATPVAISDEEYGKIMDSQDTLVTDLVTDKEVQILKKILTTPTKEGTDKNIKGILNKYNKFRLEELLMTEYVEIIHYIEYLKKKQKENMKGVL